MHKCARVRVRVCVSAPATSHISTAIVQVPRTMERHARTYVLVRGTCTKVTSTRHLSYMYIVPRTRTMYLYMVLVHGTCTMYLIPRTCTRYEVTRTMR